MFGLKVSTFEFPFYYFFIQGLKVTLPYQIEDRFLTFWQVSVWLIIFSLIVTVLWANASNKWFKSLFDQNPVICSSMVFTIVIGLFFLMHHVGSKAGHERASAILNEPRLLRPVVYADSGRTPKLLRGHLLTLTKDQVYMLGAVELQGKLKTQPYEVTILPLDRSSYVRITGHSPVN